MVAVELAHGNGILFSKCIIGRLSFSGGMAYAVKAKSTKTKNNGFHS